VDRAGEKQKYPGLDPNFPILLSRRQRREHVKASFPSPPALLIGKGNGGTCRQTGPESHEPYSENWKIMKRIITYPFSRGSAFQENKTALADEQKLDFTKVWNLLKPLDPSTS
jgi:hypothetical protein